MLTRLATLSSLMLAACGGASQPTTKPPTSDTAPPCSQEIARQCPDGQIDACLLTPPAADTHVCVPFPGDAANGPTPSEPTTSEPTANNPPGAPAKLPVSKNIACKARIRQICDEGFVDGCIGGLTTVHSCVAKGSKSTTPCVVDMILTCPAGHASSCAFSTPISDKHVCVVPDDWK